jgi:hypothetical protein
MPIVYGLVPEDPGPGVVLGGCVVGGEDPAWKCRKCGTTFGRFSFDEPAAKPLRKAGPKKASLKATKRASLKATKKAPLKATKKASLKATKRAPVVAPKKTKKTGAKRKRTP